MRQRKLEAAEAQIGLELLQEDCSISADPIEFLLCETNELISVFVTIALKLGFSE
ncbi:MAG: hypothetical protein SH807_08495 [Blastochloris sp.]|nr:hypothetical protein [Blastochloris sp.]